MTTESPSPDTRERYREKIARITLDSMVQFVGLLDANGTVLEINKVALDAVGIALADVEGKPFWETFWWQVSDDVNRTLREQIARAAKGEFVRWDTPIFGRAGGKETIIIDGSLMPVTDERGEVVFIAAEGRDITEKKASEERHRALLTASSDVVYQMNRDWTVMQPLDGGSLVGSNSQPITGWMDKNLPPFEHARVRVAIDEAISKKQTFELEHQVVRADGTLGWTHSRAVPILDEQGGIIEWLGTASDVTRRKRAEEELKDIRSRMEAALEAGAIGTWAWDVPANQFFGDLSLSHIFGLSPEAVVGGPLAAIVEAIHPEDRARVVALVQEAVESGVRYDRLSRHQAGRIDQVGDGTRTGATR